MFLDQINNIIGVDMKLKDVRSHYSLMAQDYIDQYDKNLNYRDLKNLLIITIGINIKFM